MKIPITGLGRRITALSVHLIWSRFSGYDGVDLVRPKRVRPGEATVRSYRVTMWESGGKRIGKQSLSLARRGFQVIRDLRFGSVPRPPQGRKVVSQVRQFLQ